MGWLGTYTNQLRCYLSRGGWIQYWGTWLLLDLAVGLRTHRKLTNLILGTVSVMNSQGVFLLSLIARVENAPDASCRYADPAGYGSWWKPQPRSRVLHETGSRRWCLLAKPRTMVHAREVGSHSRGLCRSGGPVSVSVDVEGLNATKMPDFQLWVGSCGSSLNITNEWLPG